MTPKPYREDIPYEVYEAHTTEVQRQDYWEIGVSLQAIDGLTVSRYAQEAARHYITGNCTTEELEHKIESYYETHDAHSPRRREADIVATRIAATLEKNLFSMRVAQLFGIHAALFRGVFPDKWVGVPRKTNLTKAESVLRGNTVTYADWTMIQSTLEYNFSLEESYRYSLPFDEQQIKHFTRFISNVWQTHAFREGNTRTIAVFSELYLRRLGIQITNGPFIENSVYFRDALVRANYSSIELDIQEDLSFIEKFYSNVILDTHYDLESLDLTLHPFCH